MSIALHARRAAVLALALLCASGAPQPAGAAGSLDESAPRGPRAMRLAESAALEPALRAAFVRALERHAAARWALEPLDGERWVAREDGAALRIDRRGVTLRIGELAAALRTARVGREGELWAAGRPGPLEVDHNAARVEREGGLVERWVHGPLGLEHLFDVAAPPPGDGPLVVELALSGALVAREAEHGAIELVDRAGRVRATYDEPWAEDAAHAALPIRLVARGDRIRIVVDDSGARYPLAVDPLLFLEQNALVAAAAGANDQLGFAVAVSGGRALVGAPFDDVGAMTDAGSAYFFVRSGATWAADVQLTGRAAGDAFGASVALVGDEAIVGAPGADACGGGPAVTDAGCAYRYLFTTTWSAGTALAPPSRTAGDLYGSSVALAPPLKIVGAPGRDAGGLSNSGAAFVFSFGNFQAMLSASDAAASDELGASVAIDAAGALVGAPRARIGANSSQGAAYYFTGSGATWTQRAKLVAAAGGVNDRFGRAVALSGGARSSEPRRETAA